MASKGLHNMQRGFQSLAAGIPGRYTPIVGGLQGAFSRHPTSHLSESKTQKREVSGMNHRPCCCSCRRGNYGALILSLLCHQEVPFAGDTPVVV